MIGGQLNYFVLSKGFTSYTYLGEYGIEANWNKGVEDIAENVRRLITSHYSWPPQTTLETHLYLSAEKFQAVKDNEGSKRKKQLEELVNDEYLKHDCPEIPPVYDLFTLKTTMESGQSLIAVGVGVQVEFPIFVRAGEDTSLTYIVNGTVDGAPKEIVKQVENQAQAAAKDFQGIGEPDISSILVCETGEASIEALLARFEPNWDGQKIPMTYLNSGVGHRVPSGKGCLFVELVTHGYNYILFREQGAQYTFVGHGIANTLPRQSLGVLEDLARDHIESLGHPNAATKTSISIWEPRGNLRSKSRQDWENLKLTAKNLDKDFSKCRRAQRFGQLARTLVVIFSVFE